MKKRNLGLSIIVSLVLVIVIIFLISVVRGGQGVLSCHKNQETVLGYPVIRATDPFKGGENAKVVLYEFSDFQCSHCKDMEPTLKALQTIYGNNLKVVWKDFPVIDQNSIAAAEAGRCAGAQGKFWEMHDLLFLNQTKLTREYYSSLARELKLDLDQFNQCLDQHQQLGLVNESAREALNLGFDSTPSFFLNQQKIDTIPSLAEFQKMIDSVLVAS